MGEKEKSTLLEDGKNLLGKKRLFIGEKPSVGKLIAEALGVKGQKRNGYIEDEKNIITWCIGHLVCLSYPEIYDSGLKAWSMESLPFIPEKFLYQVKEDVKDQYEIVKALLNREDVGEIYNCGDAGREGEYLQRLVYNHAGYNKQAKLYRIWTDAFTEEEIYKCMNEKKPMSAYDGYMLSGYERAIEDYLMGINFSRAITLKYGDIVKGITGKNSGISVGRVMTCVNGMVVQRERTIRNFKKTKFYKVSAQIKVGSADGTTLLSFKSDTGNQVEESVFSGEIHIDAEWNPASEEDGEEEKETGDTTQYKNYGKCYNKKGFLKKEDADAFLEALEPEILVDYVKLESEKKYAPLLYSLSELQAECSKQLKISPDQTLEIAQKLYESKMITYPRTNARVLSTAAAKEIYKNIRGLLELEPYKPFVEKILDANPVKKILNTRYVNDKKVSDHYAIIPTGHSCNQLGKLEENEKQVYHMIVKRFLSIFLPAAEFKKAYVRFLSGEEAFESQGKVIVNDGYLALAGYDEKKEPAELYRVLKDLKEGQKYPAVYSLHEGTTSPPSRYTSGTLILAMENAGNLIEDESLREQIKGDGIGTEATRAGILKKLDTLGHIQIQKNQTVKATQIGEYIYEIISATIPVLLSPEMTASWEKGLSMVADKEIPAEEYREKLCRFVKARTHMVQSEDKTAEIREKIRLLDKIYKKDTPAGKKAKGNKK